MKTVKKLVAVVLVSAMALSLAACGKKMKKISSDDFKSKLEKEGFALMENPESEDGIKESVMAYNEDMSVMLTFSTYEKADEAKDTFNTMKDEAKKAKDNGEIDSLSTSSNKISAKSEDAYIVVINVDEMFIYAVGEGENSGKVDDALKALGF